MHSRTLVVAEAQHGERLDRVLCDALPGLGRAEARRVCEAGLVTRAGRALAAGARVAARDVLVLAEDALGQKAPAPDPTLPLCIAYQDAALLVVDKPAGMACHPLRSGERGTLASALLARFPELCGVGHRAREPGLVHRLDTDTSGLLLVARDAASFERLSAALRAGAIDKRYLALCTGELEAPRTHRAFLRARGPRVTVRAQALEAGSPITTEITRSERAGAFSLVEVKAPFARRHQVRAHLAALGHPLAGDALYGGPALPGLAHHFLHASALSFAHPTSGARVELRAELPDALRAVLSALRAQPG